MRLSLQKFTPFAASLLVLSLAGCGAFGRCQDGPPPGPHRGGPGGPGRPDGPPPSLPRDPAFTKAFDACLAEQAGSPAAEAAEQGDSARPRLDRQAMDACLKGKGVQPPAPPPRPREHR